MRLIDALCDVKIWIAAGIVAGLAFGFDDPNASTILVVVLILQMSVALDGIRFSRDDLGNDARRILGCMLACFVLNTGLTLLIGLAFLGDRSLWTGWVMLASMPCAVSVVVSSLVMRGDTKMAVLALAVIYVAALALTPAITGAVLGSAADPLEILRYIALFIAVPFALSPLVRRIGLRPEARSVIINVMMMLMVLIGLGSRRDYIFDNLDVVLWLALACAVRTFAVGAAMVWAMRRRGVRREDGVVYLTMGVWKNSGMSISMTMALFGAVMPGAVLPCVVSLVIESVWFAVMSRLIDVLWPAEERGAAPSAQDPRPTDPMLHGPSRSVQKSVPRNPLMRSTGSSGVIALHVHLFLKDLEMTEVGARQVRSVLNP